MPVRLHSEASALGIRTAICAADADVVTKLRQIVELRDARYVLDRDAAKRTLAS